MALHGTKPTWLFCHVQICLWDLYESHDSLKYNFRMHMILSNRLCSIWERFWDDIWTRYKPHWSNKKKKSRRWMAVFFILWRNMGSHDLLHLDRPPPFNQPRICRYYINGVSTLKWSFLSGRDHDFFFPCEKANYMEAVLKPWRCLWRKERRVNMRSINFCLFLTFQPKGR